MALQYSPKIVSDGLVMCLDPSQNKSYGTTDLPVKGDLLLWLDASDDSTFTYSSGTEVSQWRDKSGNNFHANSVTTPQQPSRSTNFNSRKSVNFTAANGDTLRVSSGIITPNYITVFAVVKPAAQSNAYAVILEQDHGNGYNGWVIQRNNVASFWQSWVAGNAVTWLNPNQVAYTDNTSQIVTLRKTASTITLYSNGTSSGAVSISDSTITQTSYGINLGYWQYGNGRYYNGEISEILVFNRGLSDVELRQVNTYLGQKWGIANTDRSIIDLSGFDDNGLLGNGSTSNMPLYDYYDKGAFKFYASNKYIKLGNNTNINQFTGDFTISLWAMATAENSNYGNLIGDYYTAGVQTTNEWQIMMNNSSAFLNVYRHGTGYIVGNTSSGFSANTWINVVLTRVGSSVTLYANNNVIATATNSSVFGSATGSVNIGIDGNNASEPFSGLISNVLIYQKGLSATEVAQNYNAQRSRFADTIIHQGLVLNIDIDNPYSYAGAGTTVYDTSPTALTWTATNTTYNPSPIKYLSYNGSNSSLVSSTSTAYDSQTITMECWCYPNSLNQLGFLFEKGAVNSQYSMFFSTTNVFYFRTIGGTINNQDLTFTTTTYLTVSAWNHIVCTYNGSAKTIYVNGTQVATVAASGTLQTGQTNQYIGKYGAAGDNYPFNGRIAESRVYNIALTAAQVLQNYNATRTKYGL